MDSTVDPREVTHYTALAETWWDDSGPFWPLHRLNRLRVEYIRALLCSHFNRDPGAVSPLEGLQVLDVGCGGGILSESMAELGADVTGIDVVEKNILVARLHASRSGHSIDYRATPVSEIVQGGETFDVVLNMEVVEHVADLDSFMADCCRATAPGGVMFVATINRTPMAWLFAIFGAEYILGWLPKGTHRWRMLRKPSEIDRRLHDGGLVVRDATGVTVSPLTRQMRLVASKAVNYMLFATRTENQAGKI